MDGENAALMTREQVIDKVPDNGVGFVPELRDDATDQSGAARMPFQIDGAVKVACAVDFRPTMRPTGLFRPNFDKTEFLFELRIAHDLIA